MALKHVTTRRKPYRSTESLRRAVKTNSRGLTSLAFAQLDPGRPRDPPYLHSVYGGSVHTCSSNLLSLRLQHKAPAALPNSELNCSVVRFHRHSFILFLKPWQRRKQINASLLKHSWSKGNKQTEERTQITKLSLKIGLTLA